MEPSDEVMMVPELPTATCDGLEVVVLLSSLFFLAQEMIVKLKRNMDKMMSIYLTKFPKSGLGEPNITSIGLIYKEVGV